MALSLIGALQSATAFAQAAPRPNKVVLVDRILAVVNKDVITRVELGNRLEVVLQQLRENKVEPPPPDILERQVLERMITDRAQLQLARETGVRIEDADLDRAILNIAQSNKLTVDQFRTNVEQGGVPFARLREDVRVEMTLSRLREREVDTRVQVSEAEIDNFLAEDGASTSAATEFNISHLLVRVPEGANTEQIERLQRRAAEALGELRNGVDFARIAVAFSDAPDGLQGGAMGWRSRDRLPELFSEAVGSMKPGDTSDVLRSPAGFHIVRVTDRRGTNVSAQEVEQTRARHILVRTNEIVAENEARRKLQQLRERIAQGEKFADIARLNSDDTSSIRGGDLGWLLPGDTVPDFERAMTALAVNELSALVRSPFGWHLIEVLERKRGDVSVDRRRAEARRALRERKADEAFNEWVRQVRDRAYVEYRVEER